MRQAVCVLWVFIAAGVCRAEEMRPILTENGYFRVYYHFGLMRIAEKPLREAMGKKLLEGRSLQQLERITRLFSGDRVGNDWPAHAVMYFSRIGGQVNREDLRAPSSLPPPERWAEPGFDASGWACQRLGRIVVPEDANDFTFLYRRGIYLRGSFVVPEATAAGELSLRIVYRGGVRVLLNGREVARGDLPDGPLTPDTPATGFPREAYVALADETHHGKDWTVGEIIGPYESAPVYGAHKDFRYCGRGGAVNQKGWRRLQAMRDRILGPVKLPPALLRQGANVLAIELLSAEYHPQILPGYDKAANWGQHGGVENFSWQHAGIVSLELNGPAAVPSAMVRPAGVQAFVRDMHDRVYDTEYLPAGDDVGKVRIVGSANGAFSAQVVVGTDRPLASLNGQVGELTSVDGKTSLPASCWRVMYMTPQPLASMPGLLGQARMDPRGRMLSTYNSHGRGGPGGDRWATELKFFDQISPEPPGRVPADSAQPLWLYLAVPGKVHPGKYVGKMTVEAVPTKVAGPAADDVPAPIVLSVPVEVELAGWRMPSPAEFQTFIALEQSPYGVAAARKCPLWSEEHWRGVDSALRQLARVGNDWLFVPVLNNTEFGNEKDSPVRWIRRKDGSLAFDFSLADRYIDMATKAFGAPPAVVSFVIMHGTRKDVTVQVLDEASGQRQTMDVSNAGTQFRAAWSAFGTALYEHMKARGMARNLYWGFAWDTVADGPLVNLMREFVPEVKWTRGCHSFYPDSTFPATSTIILEMLPETSRLGWRNPFIHLVNPRWASTTACANGASEPFAFRLVTDRAIVAGHRGIGRLGADYWNDIWLKGYGSLPWLYAGMPCASLLWPGQRGADSSARFEALREGIQEAEARIFIEQVLTRQEAAAPATRSASSPTPTASYEPPLPARLAERVRQVLDEHNRQTLFYPSGDDPPAVFRYCHGWQGRSARLFATAAEVAGAVGLDLAHDRVALTVPARGRAELAVQIRNWTGRGRAFSAAADVPWLRVDRAEGVADGWQHLPVTVDAAGLDPESTAEGTVTVTDTATGGRRRACVQVTVSKVLDFMGANRVLNVTAGQAASRRYALTNLSGEALRWTSQPSAAWLKVEPPAGKLIPGQRVFVNVTAAPPDTQPAEHRVNLTLSEENGPAKQKADYTVLVIPPYRRPAAPKGQPAPLATLAKALLVRHSSHGEGWVTGRDAAPVFNKEARTAHQVFPAQVGRTKFDSAMWVVPRHETTFKVAGRGYSAFSVQVGVNVATARIGDTSVAVNFEVHVDGQVRAQSGLVTASDEPRLLVVENLRDAKVLKLVTRLDRLTDTESVWCNWAEARLYTP